MAGNAQELKTLPKGGLQDKILPKEIIVQFRVFTGLASIRNSQREEDLFVTLSVVYF